MGHKALDSSQTSLVEDYASKENLVAEDSISRVSFMDHMAKDSSRKNLGGGPGNDCRPGDTNSVMSKGQGDGKDLS